MARSFTPVDMVQLPSLDAASAISLGTSLVTAADDVGKLPTGLVRPRKRLGDMLEKLKGDAADRLPAVSKPLAPVEQSMADRRVDGSYAAFFSWLKGFAKLPEGHGDEQRAAAESLLTTLFPTDLAFTQLKYRQEWAESETRLARIEKDRLDKVIKSLGGEVFLEAIRKSHADYGKALGITAAQAPSADAPALRASLDAFLEALRSYVLKVSAHVDDEDPSTLQLASKLLAPLASWQSAPASPAAPSAPATPAPPVPAPV